MIIERGEGVKPIDVNGREYYNGNASVWPNVHGHNRRELNMAVKLDRLAHSMLLGMGYIPSIELAERLVLIAPDR